MKVIGVRFKDASKIYYFDPGELEPLKNEMVIVETTQGVEHAFVVMETRDIDTEEDAPLPKPILRIATDEDRDLVQKNAEKEKEALLVCEEKIRQHNLDMHLVDVDLAFTNNKITFYFTSDGRVDFRELVRDLASVFRTRIELRQIGVRDEAKMVGGLGTCGRVVCCKAFLNDFHSVSIKMAKEQNLSLSPTKISGICGRLMCCLKYEQECYEETRKRMPKVGSFVGTPDGRGTVLSNQIVTERVKVRVKLQDDTFEAREFPLSEIETLEKSERSSKNQGQNQCSGNCADGCGVIQEMNDTAPDVQKESE